MAMDDRELNALLAMIGKEEYRPSVAVLEAARQRLYRAPLLRAGLFASLLIQSFIWMAAIVALLSPAVAPEVKLALLFAGLAVWGCILVVLVAVRGPLAPLLARLDASLASAA
jgi:hypothetical protein